MGLDPIPPENRVKPVQILYLLPLPGNGQVTLPKILLAQESVIQMSDKPDIHDLRGSSNPSSGSGMLEFSGFSLVKDIPPPRATSFYQLHPMRKARIRLFPDTLQQLKRH